MSIEIVHGVPGSSYDDEFWENIHDLYQTCFPGLPAGIERAARLGVRWRDVTTPFVALDNGQPVSHVGVLRHTLGILGTNHEFAGFHAVCTKPEYRGRGLARELLNRACEWSDTWTHLSKLATDAPAVYQGHGFHGITQSRFLATKKGTSSVAMRPLYLDDAGDLSLTRRLLSNRCPASEVVMSFETGWLFVIDAALNGLLDGKLVYLEEWDAIVAAKTVEHGTYVLDVVAESLPPAEVVISAIQNRGEEVWWSFTPDLIDPSAHGEDTPAEYGTFMVRGEWPTPGQRFGLGWLWEH